MALIYKKQKNIIQNKKKKAKAGAAGPDPFHEGPRAQALISF